MASITAPEDYTGKYLITKNATNQAKIQQYIDLYEVQYLIALFGVEFYQQYLDGLALIPTPDPLYVKLRDPFTSQMEGNWVDYGYGLCHNQPLISSGIKNMLVGFIYWEYYKDDFSDVNINGQAKTLPENSQNSSVFMANLYSRYNESIRTYHAIQAYIKQNSTDYPNFRGIHKGLVNWF